MTLGEALAFARKDLASHNIKDAGLEAEVLLRYVLEIDRTGLYLRQHEQLTSEQEKAFEELFQFIEGQLKDLVQAIIGSEGNNDNA